MATQKHLSYIPRPAFVPMHNRYQRWAMLVCHRRSGKSFSLIHDLLLAALDSKLVRPQYAFVAPTYAQAKKVAWEYLKDAARPFLKGTPNETELRVDLVNNSRIFLAGSDNADTLRGLYLDGVVLDEFAMQSPSVWTQILRPALADRKGWAIISGTPMGKNHFFDLWNQARKNPEWFTLFLSAEASGIIPPEELDQLRREMPEDEFAQEMLCDFTATSKGAILFREIEAAQNEGRLIDRDIYDPRGEVYAAADIGFRDTAAFWLGQKKSGDIRMIHHTEASGMDASDWVEQLKRGPYPIDEIWLPHDAKARTFTTRNTAQEVFIRSGFRVRMVQRTSILDRVNAARVLARSCKFSTVNCAAGLQALRDWTYEWDDKTKIYSRTPLHNAASHSSDAFSYFAQMVYNEVRERKPQAEDTKQAESYAAGAHYAFSLEQLHDEHQQATSLRL